MIKHIFEGIIKPDWHKRIDKQLEDDAGGYGEQQSIAIFGKPGDKFEFVMTGRHMTIRCDGNSADHVAFGGPIFYGHAAERLQREAEPPGQRLLAPGPGGQQGLRDARRQAAQAGPGRQAAARSKPWPSKAPADSFPGIRGRRPVERSEGAGARKCLQSWSSRIARAIATRPLSCLEAQGGLDKCSLAFYREGDIGNDKVWDSWRLEGPSFVWYFRGAPHVHVWVNVADDPSVKPTPRTRRGPSRQLAIPKAGLPVREAGFFAARSTLPPWSRTCPRLDKSGHCVRW